VRLHFDAPLIALLRLVNPPAALAVAVLRRQSALMIVASTIVPVLTVKPCSAM
jgi:hypothetical protein